MGSTFRAPITRVKSLLISVLGAVPVVLYKYFKDFANFHLEITNLTWVLVNDIFWLGEFKHLLEIHDSYGDVSSSLLK